MNEKERTAVLVSSTPIDDRQPPEPKSTNSVPQEKLNFNGKSVNPLKTIDGKTLLEKDLPPISFTIKKILPQGLFIVVGSPKVGKSWLSLEMCVTVANGKELWGNSAEKGIVLYLALEDSLNRLQARLKKYTDETVTNSNIHFAIRSHKLGDGLVLQVQDFLQRYPDTRLIIIDTMQRIRNNGNDKNAYVSDYRDMEILCRSQATTSCR